MVMAIIQEIFLFLSLFLHCSNQDYQLHLNESLYYAHKNTNQIAPLVQPDSAFQISGIYNDNHLFLDQYPVIQVFEKSKGFFTLPINQKLSCPNGSLVQIEGRISILSRKFPYIKKISHYQLITVHSEKFIKSTHPALQIVIDEYQKLKPTLEKSITLRGSKLKLKSNPEWIIYYDQSHHDIFFISHHYDLMYAANIEFILDEKTNQIKDVYAKEWFKGEF